MNERNFLNRLVTFSFEGNEDTGDSHEVIVLMPENTTVQAFKKAYNDLVFTKELHNRAIHEELKECQSTMKDISAFLKKYDNKDSIKEKMQTKITQKEKELDELLQNWSELRNQLVDVNFEGIVQSIGGIIIHQSVAHVLNVEHYDSMIAFAVEPNT